MSFYLFLDSGLFCRSLDFARDDVGEQGERVSAGVIFVRRAGDKEDESGIFDKFVNIYMWFL
jgi:hypothetical protein